jgi:hypothetical protein
MTRERALKRYLSPLSVCVLATCAILSAAQGAATDLAENASTGTRAMAIIKVSADKRHFVREGTDQRFIAWGFNYDRDDAGRLLEDYWEKEWSTVVDDFREMKALGANVVRIHLQLAAFMKTADRIDRTNFVRLGKLVQLAEDTGLYLDITGLGCYRKQDVPAWYDRMGESARWNVQARFWRAVASVCKDSPAVFCYDLMNEPVASGDREGAWLPGEGLAGKYYVQRLTTEMRGRNEKEIARAWIAKLTAAIRAVDTQHMITVGVIPWEQTFKGAKPVFYAPDVCGPLDFVSIHLYPKEGKLEDDLAVLKAYEIGKPLVIEEIFPLSASIDATQKFIERSRPDVDGWISFYWGTTADEYEKRKGDAAAALTENWLRRFGGMLRREQSTPVDRP